MNKNVFVPDQIFTVSNVLSSEECAEYIALTEKIGYTPAGLTMGQDQYFMAPNVRNNDRVILDDEARAAQLWHRIAEYIPVTIDGWTALGLNERLRFYRYDPGQRFAPHGDGSFMRQVGEMSLLTFMIYLNDGFEGGETHFLEPDISVVPTAGMALCFRHELLHEGDWVIRGRKYVLRSDVMYNLGLRRKRRKQG